MSEGPRVLILGGLGFIGRNLVHYLTSYQLASYIRVVDKTPFEMQYMNDDFRAAFQTVDVQQGNLADPSHVERAFTADQPFTIVINLAAETRYGLMPMLYENFIFKLRVECAKMAAAHRVDKYIEVSTCQVYSAENGKPAKETGKLKPYTVLAETHLRAENAIKEIPGLNFIILRLPIVYGPGDRSGLMPRIICAALYQHTGEKMEFLWNESLRCNTIHVQDVAAAIWHAVCAASVGETYNLVDDNDTSQGKLNTVLESVFRIKTGFVGSVMSTLAQVKLDELVEDANEGHLEPWVELCKTNDIANTPLTPIIEKELLYNTPLCVDASKFKTELGFQCSCPELTKDLIVDSMEYWQKMKLFPTRY